MAWSFQEYRGEFELLNFAYIWQTDRIEHGAIYYPRRDATSECKQLLVDFDEKVKQKFLIKDLKVDLTNVPAWSILDDALTAEVVDNVVILEADDVDVQTFDKLVGSRVSIVRGGERAKGVVKRRAQDEYGN